MEPPRTRTTTWSDPRDVVAALAELDGLEALERTCAGELPHPPIAETFGMRLVEVEAGHVVWEAEPGEHLYNPIGTVHAGFAVTLLDSAMGTAFVSTAPAGTRWTTLELKASFTRAITADTGVVRSVGTILNRGRRVVTTEARLEDSDGRLLAHATSTILVLDSS
jgi:uncharacterized protein (TIGR00369 family)